MSGLSLRIARRFLRGSAVRLHLTVAAVACGVALVCAVDLVNNAVFQAFVEIVDTMAGRAALHVTAGEGGLFPEEVGATVAGVPGVELTVPVVSASAFTTDGTGEQLSVHGVDITNDAAVRVYEPAGTGASDLDDPLIFLNQADSVMLTQEFAGRRGVDLGDTIELDTPTGRLRFTVRGLLAPTGIARAQGGNLLVMDIAAAELAFTKAGLVNRVDVVVRRDATVAQVADRIAAILPPGLRVEAPAQRKADLHRVMQSVQTLFQTVGILGLIAAFLIAFSRLTTVFEARVWQLAILRSGGVRTRRVWWELTKESLLVGVTGVAIGIPLGIGLGRLLLPVIATTTAITSKLVFAETRLHVRTASLVEAAVLGLVSVVLAASIPAWRAAQVAVAQTLRQQGVEQEDCISRVGWAMRGALLALMGIAVLVHLRNGSAISGLIASALVVVTVAVSARAFLAIVAGPLKAVSARAGGPVGRFAVATLLRSPRRTALALSTLGVGFGSVLWLWTLARSFEQSVIDVMPSVLRGDLAVSSVNIGAGYVEAPVDERLIGDLECIGGVAGVVGEQGVDWPYRGGPIALNAFDPAYFADRTFGSWILVGRSLPGALDAVARGEAVIVSENFVRNLGLSVGEVVTLETPSGPLSLRIAGVVRDFLSPRGTIEMSREVYRARWRDGHIMRALVRVAPGEDPERVRVAIAAQLGQRYGLKILALRSLIDWFTQQVRRAFSGLHVLGALVLVVVMVGLGDTLAAGTLERAREFGIVRAAGVRRAALGRMVLVEGLILGIMGLLLALVLGLALGTLWVKATFPALLGWTLTFHLPLAEIAGVALAAVVVCLVSSYLPASRATRLDPAVALRSE